MVYGLIGLHTCGDLGPILLTTFLDSTDCVLLQSVGCCYMRLTSSGYPLSNYLKKEAWNSLTYTSLELACHAIETYSDRLRTEEEMKLKVHCYRALLEKILVSKDPSLRHLGLATVKNAHEMSFSDYAKAATKNLPAVSLSDADVSGGEVEKCLARWWQVVVFYSLRLSLAPLIETVVLADRCLYLYEGGRDSLLLPLFDPRLSPRNHVLVAVKNDTQVGT